MSNPPMEDQLPIDPFLQLLTDALRSGPGSPEWHQAIARVNAGETGPENEYALLVQARENLASGKSYREVRPGIGFTRKVLASINKDAAATAAKKSPLSASLISYLGAGLVVASLGVVIFWLIQGSGGPVQPEDLTSMLFSKTLASVSFNAPLPAGWRRIGPLDIDFANGLAPSPGKIASDYVNGGVVSTIGINPPAPFAVEASFQFQKVSDDIVPQVFVTDDPTFSLEKATSPRELLWMVRGGMAIVALPNGELTTGAKKISDGELTSVRIVVGARDAAVLCDGAILWSGNSQLAVDKPRYAGVRLLCKKSGKQTVVTVKELRELGK